MSDKLKIMQTRIATTSSNDEGDLFCASIGYPDLKLPASVINDARGFSDEQPIIDDSAFKDYVSKAEFEDFVARGA